jgi:ATP-dependent Clp protease ATP-binding subunit ClpA
MKDFEKAREKIVANLSDYFPPEFINRIDKIVVFNPLDKNHIKKIVKLQLDELVSRLEKKYLTLVYDQRVLNSITKKVYNPEF